jgi:hypothetical protein
MDTLKLPCPHLLEVEQQGSEGRRLLMVLVHHILNQRVPYFDVMTCRRHVTEYLTVVRSNNSYIAFGKISKAMLLRNPNIVLLERVLNVQWISAKRQATGE